jgi:hypothetical protein
MKPLQKVKLDFATIQLYDNFAVSSIQEGVTLTKKQLDQFFEVFNTYFPEKPFVSIANREFDYSIDPNLLKSKRHASLLGIAVVCYNKQSRQTAQFEKIFYNGPFEIFDSIEEAIKWSQKLLNEFEKNAGL